MNKFLSILKNAFLPILFVSLALVACEGPKGADGPAGPAGPTGPTGTSGAEQCGVCHNNGTELFTRQVQWEESVHGTGDIYIYGNRTDCAYCHTSQGFLEFQKTGAAAGAPYNQVATINCRTCHNIHSKYDASDWGFTKTSDITFYETAAPKQTANIGKGNLCGQCHQARPTTPVIDLNSSATYSITSSRFGAHHSPAANTYTNNIAWVPTGTAKYPTTNVHSAATDGCVTCHMSQGPVAHGTAVGGHTFRMVNEDGSVENVTACITCHNGEVTSKFNDKEGYFSKFQGDMHTADSLFQAKGWRTSTGSWANGGKSATSSNPLVVTQNQAAAIYAYQSLLEDKSWGIHNPKYARAILDNILEVLNQ